MKSPWSSKHLLLLSVLTVSGAQGLASADRLELAAATPEITVSTRPAGRNFLNLPGLTYDFVIDLACSEGHRAESLSLSIADTRITLGAERLAGSAPVTIDMSVPAGQIGPVALAGFCVLEDDDEPASRQSLTIPAVLSAQASLLCASESVSRRTYASRTLDIVIHCDADQDASSVTID